jgi:hypothetical protein
MAGLSDDGADGPVETRAAWHGSIRCNSVQNVAGTACVCGVSFVCDPSTYKICAGDAHCEAGHVCAWTCCTDPDTGKYLSLCVTLC